MNKVQSILLLAFISGAANLPAKAEDIPYALSQPTAAVFHRAMSPFDSAVTFTVNDRPIGYKVNSAESKQADELLKKAIKVARFSSADNQPSLASALDCAGVMYYRSGEYRKSWDCFEESLELKKKMGSAQDLANGYALLGQVTRARAKYSDAEKLYKDACQLIEKEFGANSKELAIAYVDLANCYYDMSEQEKGGKSFNMSSQIASSYHQANDIDLSSFLRPVSLVCTPASSAFAGLTQIAANIITTHEMELAEKKAEEEAMDVFISGKIPKREVSYSRFVRTPVTRNFRSQYENDDSGELERRRMELQRQMLEEQQKQLKADEERRRQEAEEYAAQRRREEEQRFRERAEEATRRLEEEQANLQRQRERAGTGTSYMSRYNH